MNGTTPSSASKRLVESTSIGHSNSDRVCSARNMVMLVLIVAGTLAVIVIEFVIEDSKIKFSSNGNRKNNT